MNLLDAIAAAIPPIDPVIRQPRALGFVATPATARPVLQFGPIPSALDVRNYADARSNIRPNGDILKLFAFRQLVDPVPGFTRFYAPNGSTEQIYQAILEGATLTADSVFTARLLDTARKQFDVTTFPYTDGSPDRWRPVYAQPDDWYDLSIDGRFQDLAIDLTDQGGKIGPYAMIGDAAPLELAIDGQGPIATAPDPGTTVHSFRMKYFLVTFRRPWFRSDLFQTNGWLLSRQPSGFCSSGDLSANQGVLPLLPTGMLLGKDVNLDVTWGKTDQARLGSPGLQGTRISLGPFRLDLSAPASEVHIIAWTSSLIPFSPRQTDLSGP